jgi:hypothetical protein
MKKVTTIVIMCALIVSLLGVSLLLTGIRHVQAQKSLPHSTCFGDGCDFFTPPPVANCGSSNFVAEQVDLYDKNHFHIGVLQLRFSEASAGNGGCNAAWAASRADNTQYYTVDALGVFESSGCDNDSEGALDTLPHTIGNGAWESTYMTGWCGSGPSYHASIVITDAYGVKSGFINTSYFTP